jgi:protein-tyrosine-phosphatase
VPDLATRAELHRVLGDPRRLAIVDELRRSDRTPSELGALTDTPSNLLAHHLHELEHVGLVHRTRSDGDGRRRYVQLAEDPAVLLGLRAPEPLDGDVLFVCTHNAARSQLAAALWHHRTGARSLSAGTEPAAAVAPGARRVARRHGLEVDDEPRNLDAVRGPVGLVVTVCDRAREHGGWPEAPVRHWSVPDPVGGPDRAFEDAFDRICERIDRLVAEVTA